MMPISPIPCPTKFTYVFHSVIMLGIKPTVTATADAVPLMKVWFCVRFLFALVFCSSGEMPAIALLLLYMLLDV